MVDFFDRADFTIIVFDDGHKTNNKEMLCSIDL